LEDAAQRPSIAALAEFHVARLSDLFAEVALAACCECGDELGLASQRLGVRDGDGASATTPRAAKSGFAFEEIGELPTGGIRWMRGEREESEAAPLCPACAAAIGLTMHHRRMLRDDEEG
jgi:hypothetical protein